MITKFKDGDVMKKLLFVLSAFLFTGSAFCSSHPTFSPVVNAGDFLYVSAQFPIDSTTGKIISGDMETLTNQVMSNLVHLLHLNGVTLHQVIKTEVCLTDIRDYDSMNSAYGQWFSFKFPPARDVMQVSNLLYNSPIQISCIAYRLRD